MKLHGTFLAGTAARRIFWTLLVAAAVPLTLFGLGIRSALSSHFEVQTHRQQVQLAKLAGLGLLERLVVARTVLEVTARSGAAHADSRMGERRGRVLAAVARLDAQGHWVDGSPSLHQRWSHVTSRWQGGNVAATLVLGERLATADGMPVLMAVRPEGSPESVWIGEIDPAFLFDEVAPEADGPRICVFDGSDRAVFCPARPGAQAVSARPENKPSWNLFLRSDFGVDDWTLTRIDAPLADSAAADALIRLAALGGLATLLIVVMLTLVQVRRTMVPLQMLIAGTRRLSERDYAVRVHLRRHDEFGELAGAFNHMAERIGRQVQAMHVQSSIDREILAGLDVARALQRVALRLEQIAPGATAAVVEFRRSALARAYRSNGALALPALSRAQAAAVAGPATAAPPWVSQVLGRPVAHWSTHAAKHGDELLALMVLGFEQDSAFDDPDKRREIGELCDRVSVMLASADRERRLLERATHDGLTGLVNRAGLHETLEAMLAEDGGTPFAVMFIDLDRFKDVNDSMGHQVGDELLCVLAQRLQQCVPTGTVVARPGGDEFVLVLRGSPAAADALAPTVCAELARPLALGGRRIVSGGSVGIALHPQHGTTVSDLMRRADMAMYSAKARGGGVAAWFEPALDERLSERAARLAEIDQALERGEFLLHYQPRIDARGGGVIGAEALLRWYHPQLGMVPVPTFIELLEETGLIERVGLWVIDEALRQLAQWRRAGLTLDSIAVNLSTRQLHSDELPQQVDALLALHGLRARDLELEVTESIFVGESAAHVRVLQRLHERGIRIALDDFGTGYSSLSYLHRLPICVLKVDRSFVEELGVRDSALVLTRSIVALAGALNLRVVAEGVESHSQAELLRTLGCDELQGYLFAKPLEAEAFAAYATLRHAADAVAM